MAKQTGNAVQIMPPMVRFITVTIEGDSDLILNKMDDVTVRMLTDQRKDKAKSMEKPNPWEKVITSMHWRDGKPTDFSEEGLERALKENAPCISAFGLIKSWGDAVVRNGIDTYATKFRAAVNIVAPGKNLVPIRFAEHYLDEKLMSPKRGAPVLATLNCFTGWSADIPIKYLETSYSDEQIVNIISLAGFGLGIGSGRSSGFGRYHVTDIK